MVTWVWQFQRILNKTKSWDAYDSPRRSTREKRCGLMKEVVMALEDFGRFWVGRCWIRRLRFFTFFGCVFFLGVVFLN